MYNIVRVFSTVGAPLCWMGLIPNVSIQRLKSLFFILKSHTCFMLLFALCMGRNKINLILWAKPCKYAAGKQQERDGERSVQGIPLSHRYLNKRIYCKLKTSLDMQHGFHRISQTGALGFGGFFQPVTWKLNFWYMFYFCRMATFGHRKVYYIYIYISWVHKCW